MMQPNVNKAVPRTVWNAVGKSTQGLFDKGYTKIVSDKRSIRKEKYYHSSFSGGGDGGRKNAGGCPGPRLEALTSGSLYHSRMSGSTGGGGGGGSAFFLCKGAAKTTEGSG